MESRRRTMKVIIAGSRSIDSLDHIEKAVVRSKFIVDEIVSGTARGADRYGEIYARLHDIYLTRMPANWNLHGKSAGYKRNVEMAEYADAVIVIWDGVSKGSKHMMNIAEARSMPLYVYNINDLIQHKAAMKGM